jgi:hypothetical protein
MQGYFQEVAGQGHGLAFPAADKPINSRDSVCDIQAVALRVGLKTV